MVGGVLLNHTATVWRSSEARSGTLRVKARTWAKVSGLDGVRLGVQRLRERREDVGPGETVGSEFKGFGPAGFDVQEGDVVELTAGDEAPRTLLVDGAYRPMGRHLELTLTTWPGSLS